MNAVVQCMNALGYTAYDMSTYSIIFCGTPDFAVPALTALVSDKSYDVRLVITQPDRPVGRKAVLTSPPVKIAAEDLGLPVFQPENINVELLPYLANGGIERPDFLVVVAYGKILRVETLALPKVAAINVHGSLLPRWRGASPVEHAVLHGDAKTGVTVQIMAKELDAGDVLSMKETEIGARETAPHLRHRLSLLGAELLADTLKKPLKPVAQPQEGITICRKLSKEDGLANPTVMDAREIDRKVRAFNPWPGVLVTVDGIELKLIETSLDATPESIPLLCANNTILHLMMVQPIGKKPMSGAAWKRGIKK